MQTTVDPTTIGAFVTIILAFLGIAKIMLNQATKDREADRKERILFAKAVQDMSTNMARMADPEINGNQQIADGITRQADESAERNGHLGEQNVNIVKLIVKSNEHVQKIADTAVKNIIKGVAVQHVKKQSVDEQQVKHQSVSKE